MNTTAPSSVSMTAEEAGSAIEAMLSGPPEDQQEVEALGDDESPTDEVEDAVEEDAAADETEVEESDEEVDQEEQEQPPKFTVKVDGKDVEVSLEELQKGYSRTEDYTRKTQALAQERKAAQAEFETVRAERAQYAQLLGALQQQLQQAEPQVDMERLYQEDPIEWVRQRELQRVNAEKQMAIQAEQQRLAQENQRFMLQQQQQRLQQEKDLLLSAVPELKDPKVASKAKEEMMQAGKAIGLTDQELNSITDHRFLLALRKIAQYDNMVAKRQAIKPEPAATPTAKPGLASRKPQQSQRIKQSQQRLKSTGNVRDAASLIANLL
jgi:hypothetical protein